MDMDRPTHAASNRIWTRQLFCLLASAGVKHVCVAPGSRSTPLTLEAELNRELTLHTHFDERGLGFLALGLAKTTDAPVAVVVTSGTAVANLLPAVAEANLTGEKLILLTADRPPELVGVGANQAIVQAGIFSGHVTASVELSCPELDRLEAKLSSPVLEALELQTQKGGALHINCPFREPLYVRSEDEVERFWPQYANNSSACESHLQQSSEANSEAVALHRFGVVVIGSVSLDEARAAKAFAKALGWPVLCDVQSGASSEFAGFDLWMECLPTTPFAEAIQVVQFGSRLVSKRLNQWMVTRATQRPDFTIDIVSDDWRTIDPNRLGTKQHRCDIQQWVEVNTPSTTNQTNYIDSLAAEQRAAALLIEWKNAQQQRFAVEPISELGLAMQLPHTVANHDTFVGNSLIVRLLDMLGQWQECEVFTNRGASGIDGLIATSVGVMRGRENAMLGILGDTSALYDLNSLALLANSREPNVTVVVNNDGGAIFDLLPVDSQKREALYQMPHGMSFQFAAKQFGLGYEAPKTVAEFDQVVTQHLTRGQGSLLLEVAVEPQQAQQQLGELKAWLKSKLADTADSQ